MAVYNLYIYIYRERERYILSDKSMPQATSRDSARGWHTNENNIFKIKKKK